MNWNFLITFGVGVGVYLLILGIITLVKRYKNKKIADSDKEKFESENSNKVNDDNVSKD